jgi:hypothetical protein
LGLEERLVIYRFREEGKSRLALNPRLETALTPITSASLFPVLSAPADGAKPTISAPLDGRTLAAVFAFLLSGKRLSRTDDEEGAILRKKAIEDGKRFFPALDMEALSGGIAALGLVLRDGERFRGEGSRLAAFRELDGDMRAAYLAAGTALYLQREDRSSSLPLYYTGGLIRGTALLVRRLVDALRAFDAPPGRLFPRSTLIKLGEILRNGKTSVWDFAGEIPRIPRIITAMEKTGLLSGGPDAYRLPAFSPPETPGAPVIAFDSSISFIMYPGIPFAGALELALSCGLEETGTALRFSLSRDSAAREFDRGGSAAEIWELLLRLSNGRVDESLKFNLEDWERRYREVALYEGVTVVLGGQRAYLAEHGPLARIVRRVLVKAEQGQAGVYLLDVPGLEEAAAALRDAGVDIFAVPAPFHAVNFKNENVFPRLEWNGEDLKIPFHREPSPAAAFDAEKAERILNGFRSALNEIPFERHEKEALLFRIERRTIVSAAQLVNSSFRYEKLAARALDYPGKALIAKQAAVTKALLEITWSAGGSAAVAGTAESLEKKDGETVLLFRPREGGEALRIPLGKISLMRRVKQSIFGE